MPRRIIRALDVSKSSLRVRCTSGTFIAILGVLLRALLDPVLNEQMPFAISMAAVALATWVAGIGGGVCAAIVSAILINFVIVAPHFQFAFSEHGAGGLLFIAVALAFVWQVGRWRRAEDALRVSEASAREARERLEQQFLELEAIYRSAPVGLCVLDREMRWVRLNDRLAQMNGYPVEAHIGRRPHELLPGVEGAEEALRHVIESGEALPDFELTGATPAAPDVQRWWRERWAPIKDPNGTVVGVAVATEDITEEKRAERTLRAALETAREREAEISSIYDSAPIGLCIIDRDGRFLRINRRLAEINGLPPAAHIGRTVHEVLPAVAGQAEALLRRVIETGEETDVEITGEVPSSPGVVHTWIAHWYPVRDETGAVVGVNVAVEEITERKRIEQELREANQIKDDFLATLSHELRTPLNAVLGWSQMLARGGLDERLTSQAVDTILRNAQAQYRLVTDVLEVSRMISGKVRLDVHETNLVPLLRNALESIAPAAQAKHLSLDFSTVPEPVLGMVDGERIQQVFWNLLSNAVKFTESGGRVSVRVERGDSRIEVVVEDTGIGISPAFLPRVFDRFTQADSSTSRRHSGLGLGLSIVQHLVELHGGTVSATSEGEGRGAKFVVSLPAVSAEREPTALAAGHTARRPPAEST